MRAFVSVIALVGCFLIGTRAAFAAPVSPGGEQATGQSRLADLGKGSLRCRIQRTHPGRTWTPWWSASSETMRPRWIAPARWPQLFADGRYTTLSLDPILRRHWWD